MLKITTHDEVSRLKSLLHIRSAASLARRSQEPGQRLCHFSHIHFHSHLCYGSWRLVTECSLHLERNQSTCSLSPSPFFSLAIRKWCLTTTHHSSAVSQSMDAGVKQVRIKSHLQHFVSNLRWIKCTAIAARTVLSG